MTNVLLCMGALLIHSIVTEHMVTAPKHAIYNMLFVLLCKLHSNV